MNTTYIPQTVTYDALKRTGMAILRKDLQAKLYLGGCYGRYCETTGESLATTRERLKEDCPGLPVSNLDQLRKAYNNFTKLGFKLAEIGAVKGTVTNCIRELTKKEVTRESFIKAVKGEIKHTQKKAAKAKTPANVTADPRALAMNDSAIPPSSSPSKPKDEKGAPIVVVLPPELREVWDSLPKERQGKACDWLSNMLSEKLYLVATAE